MGQYENPSADKFGPPPGSSDPKPTPTGPSPAAVRIIGVLVFFPLLKLAVEHYGRHTWWAIAVMLVILWAEGYSAHRRRVQRGDGPYSPDQHVTR